MHAEMRDNRTLVITPHDVAEQICLLRFQKGNVEMEGPTLLGRNEYLLLIKAPTEQTEEKKECEEDCTCDEPATADEAAEGGSE